MQRWYELEWKGYVKDTGLESDLQVECLKSWSFNKTADLKLVTALCGREVEPEESFQEALEGCILKDASNIAHLNR